MPKSASSREPRNFLDKQTGIYIVMLLLGIGIGVILPDGIYKTPEPSETAPIVKTECASVAIEPKEEFLGAPKFKMEGTIFSSKDGLILVRWHDVKGAKNYKIRVWDESGKELKNLETNRSFVWLKNLPMDPKQKETPYWVVVTPYGDTPDMKGKDSEKKMVAMLPLRNLDPPTIKSIHTEEEVQPDQKNPSAAEPPPAGHPK